MTKSYSEEALTESQSLEQVANEIGSISLHTDDNNDCDPCELYGKYTWKIHKFSQINKRELRSNAFEVGGYKWCILMYPQGCDDSNDHLSLFLCVANHDNLLPEWSHYAQFTIAVVNKDPKKSKYSDTLHRFWKKEHDWGWKNFMELSKVLDGFLDGDILTIKVQIQVIRERVDRPFRCLDSWYKRELIRVYLSNVDENTRRFVEETQGRFQKFIEDKVKWSSFCSFWSGSNKDSIQQMLSEDADLILKKVVKHFFIEKEVLSTLMMDSLYNGVKALEVNGEFVRMEKGTFILVGDLLELLERAASESLIPEYENDLIKDSIEADERRLIELGRITMEIVVLSHIFSKIEVAYQEE